VDTLDYDIIAPKFAEDMVEKVFAAWNTRNGNALAALCSPEVIWSDALAPSPITSPPEVSQFVAWFFASVPDGRFELVGKPALSTDSRIVYQQWRFIGTNTGAIDPPGFAPTGKSLDISGVDQFQFRDDLIASYRAFFDRAEILTQLGIMPSPQSRGERVFAFVQRMHQRLAGS
jgi:ketosteroid isomerase-like protein